MRRKDAKWWNIPTKNNMNKFNMWLIRNFSVITREKALELGLRWCENIHGDEINMIGCRSIWQDYKGRFYRIQSLSPLDEYGNSIDMDTKRISEIMASQMKRKDD